MCLGRVALMGFASLPRPVNTPSNENMNNEKEVVELRLFPLNLFEENRFAMNNIIQLEKIVKILYGQ